jgi:hypothetical protein
MPHDNDSITISRYDGSASWKLAIRPASGDWFVFVDKDGLPHTYLRKGLAVDADGHRHEDLVCIASPPRVGPTPTEARKTLVEKVEMLSDAHQRAQLALADFDREHGPEVLTVG